MLFEKELDVVKTCKTRLELYHTILTRITFDNKFDCCVKGLESDSLVRDARN